MAKYHSGIFVPKNPEKYVGNKPPHWRSSWELSFCQVCDNHPSIIEWAYEAIEIPYQNPLTGKWHRYIPDFLVMYLDASGMKRCELVEIKPSTQAVLESARSKRDKEAFIINEAKWAAARLFCKRRGIVFRVMTEHDLYATNKNKKPSAPRKAPRRSGKR